MPVAKIKLVINFMLAILIKDMSLKLSTKTTKNNPTTTNKTDNTWLLSLKNM